QPLERLVDAPSDIELATEDGPSLPERDLMSVVGQKARRFEACGTSAHHQYASRVRCAGGLDLVLATGGRVDDTAHPLTDRDVADTAVLVDARADAVLVPGQQLGRQIGVGQQF